MTERLYYSDSYQTRFEARVTHTRASGCEVVLDRTAFYPTSGGQPHDLGTLGGIPVVDVSDEGDEVVHHLAQPLTADVVEGLVDWPRRYDLMCQHTGQHLFSAVLASRFQRATVSVAFNEEVATIEVAGDAAAVLDEAVQIANQRIVEDLPISVSFEDAAAADGLRKPSGRAGTLRIITIESLDRSACGGTHVRTTRELAPLFVRRTERLRGNTRIEFLCAGRARRAAERDFQTLNQIARLLTAGIPQTPAAVEQLLDRAKAAESALRKADAELAQWRAHARLRDVTPEANGVRWLVETRAEGGVAGELQLLAQQAATFPRAVIVGLCATPPSLVIGLDPQLSLHAGNLLKPLLQRYQGRGGGSATLAQGTLPDPASLSLLLTDLKAAVLAAE
jgi:alanyl-tRNA synthetase